MVWIFLHYYLELIIDFKHRNNVLCELQVVGIFGFSGEDHIGKVSFPPVQVSIFAAY